MKIVETVTTLRNKQVVLRNYVTGFPKESLDMKIVETITTLKLPKDPNEVLLKNLYLSYDAYMQILMTKDRLVQVGPYALGRLLYHADGVLRKLNFVIGLSISNFKVLESRHLDYKKGDLVWGITKWEEYSLIPLAQIRFKIEHINVPLSYYTGILWTICLLGCDPRLTTSRYLTPIVRQSVKFRDMSGVERKC
ncbi:hypothetical protein JHK82_050548 [Glycine max]|uniref:Oxidoreductase N-terminal domain-containing protein n=1 Tax=Glycine max TaxID=3847 RepID=K7MSJ1_SOYBN|nr:hypothetical protein JHK86_050398 [Glycine max]KAG4924701.1 hypothetical protein JHK87_050241 [Glycine soja]KAG4936341.1 hypothetical protein JHK85_051260 [Glycine max]KAG5091770.1 hypothetical protein JHK82_050548 [Glycine max]KAG5094870.1 hypothetical protein JHK84_050458 [Glycine max]